jgi:transposase
MKPQSVGPLIATAFVSSLGDGQPFRKGRDYAVFLGLTPRQHSSGGKDRILGISKRGESHLESGTKRGDQGDPLLYQLQ